MPRLVDQGITKLLWVPGEDGIADIAAPTLTELAAGVDLTCQMVTTYEVRPDGSDTTNERAVCETSNVVTPTVQNYMGRFELFRQWDAQANEWETEDVLEYLEFGDLGWFVRRLGLPQDTDYAAAQVVEVYKFMVDSPQTQGGTGSGYLKATVPLLQQGSFRLKSTVTDDS